MKILTFLAAIVLCFTMATCKKPVIVTGLCCVTLAYPIHFDIIGKDGKNIVHSVKDSLMVTYVINGVTKTNRLRIYKVQVSATDTTAVSKYNGYAISDRDGGYISATSKAGVRNFNLYLNSANIGAIYLDWSANLLQPSSSFTFNGTPVTFDYLIGFYNDGDGIVSELEGHIDSAVSKIAVLQMK